MSGEKSATRLFLLQAVFLLLFFSLFFVNGRAFSSDENHLNDFSLFSSQLSLSQEDYRKESLVNLAEEGLQQNIDEGVVTALNNSELLDTAQEEKQIIGQDYAEEGDLGEEQKREAIEYYVKEGDTLSSVAEKFGIRLQTILWANRLDVLSVIQPGDKLTIPPEDGVMYTVKRGDTLLAVADRYNSDPEKIALFNQLDEDLIVEGQILFLPGGEMPEEPASTSLASTQSSSSVSSSGSESSSYFSSSSSSGVSYYSEPRPVVRRYTGGGSHRFPYGYCTWYVASRRGDVTWGGNASAWLANAAAAGRATGNTPVPGAIMVTRESWWGHVAYVESVSGNSVTISEMNYAGFGVVSRRTLNKNSWVIRGYIY